MARNKPSAEKVDTYQTITDRLLALMAQGTVPWRKPWTASTAPRNVRGHLYRGINVWMTLLAGYADPRWLTFQQALDLGGHVRKGEKGTPVILWKPWEKPDPEDPTKKVRGLMLRHYWVWNVEQCDDLDLAPLAVANAAPDPIEEAERVIAGYADRGPTWDEQGGDRCYYSPLTDSIHVPNRRTFKSMRAFYKSLFHEMGHSTGHASRCNREGITGFDHFGSDQYSREELVAEMTSAFLAAECSFPDDEDDGLANSAAYLAGWMSKAKEDKRLIITAAGKAQHAADYILARGQYAEEPIEQEQAA